MCVEHIPSPLVNARNKVQHIYTGPLDTEIASDMINCDPEVFILFFIIIIKYYHRVYSSKTGLKQPHSSTKLYPKPTLSLLL